MIFSRKDLFRLLGPLIVEQILAVLVGMVDVMMVAAVGEAAVSGVALVDSVQFANLFSCWQPCKPEALHVFPVYWQAQVRHGMSGCGTAGINYSRRVISVYSSGVNWKQASALSDIWSGRGGGYG